MKKLTISLFLIFGITNLALTQIFIPEGEMFVEKKITLEKQTLSNIAKSLGYNPEQFYIYSDYYDNEKIIWAVAFKSFTDKIIFVAVNNELKTLTKEMVDKYLINYNFSKEFDSYDIEATLNDGISNKSLTSEFLSDVFNIQVIKNGEMNATSIGYKLVLKDGYLISYSTSDGLNKWARDWKENYPNTFEKYKIAAEKYWGNKSIEVINEINTQADAFVKTPSGMQNEFIDLHRTNEETINFKMLLVSHYNHKITLDEFKIINFGRYEIISDFSDKNKNKITTLKVNKTLCSFTENGELLNTFTTNY